MDFFDISAEKITRVLTLCLLTASLMAGSATASVVIVVAADSPIKTLNLSHIRNIFLGKTHYLDRERKYPASPVDRDEGSVTRATFYKDFISVGESELKAYWSRMIFTGRGQPPPQLHSDEEVKRYLNRYPHGIGYVSEDSVDASVRTVELSD